MITTEDIIEQLKSGSLVKDCESSESIALKRVFSVKKGDYIYVESGILKYIAIFNYVKRGKVARVFCAINASSGKIVNFVNDGEHPLVYFSEDTKVMQACQDQIDLLNSKLEEQGYVWDCDNNIFNFIGCSNPKIGDKCAFWNDGDTDVIISELQNILNHTYRYKSKENGAFHNCAHIDDFDFKTNKLKTR